MRGWLVVNGFLRSEKFDRIYNLLYNAALNKGIDFKLKRTYQLVSFVGSDFSGLETPDFVCFWDKDIYLAQLLENRGIPVFNSAKGIELCDNKALTAIRLSKSRVAIPKTYIAPKTFEGINRENLDFLDKVEEEIGYPLVIKEAYGSFGAQVYLAKNKEKAEEIINKIGHKDFVLQEYIKSSRGKDIRINVVGEKVVASMLRYNEKDFRSNISNGGTAENYEPTKAQCDLALKATKALGLDFGGVDILFGENDKPVVCEVNSNPHFESTLKYTGVNLAEYIIDYIVGKIK